MKEKKLAHVFQVCLAVAVFLLLASDLLRWAAKGFRPAWATYWTLLFVSLLFVLLRCAVKRSASKETAQATAAGTVPLSNPASKPKYYNWIVLIVASAFFAAYQFWQLLNLTLDLIRNAK